VRLELDKEAHAKRHQQWRCEHQELLRHNRIDPSTPRVGRVQRAHWHTQSVRASMQAVLCGLLQQSYLTKIEPKMLPTMIGMYDTHEFFNVVDTLKKIIAIGSSCANTNHNEKATHSMPSNSSVAQRSISRLPGSCHRDRTACQAGVSAVTASTTGTLSSGASYS
jgi:hypothetical protein